MLVCTLPSHHALAQDPPSRISKVVVMEKSSHRFSLCFPLLFLFFRLLTGVGNTVLRSLYHVINLLPYFPDHIRVLVQKMSLY